MIKLERPTKPEQLSTEWVQEKNQSFLRSGNKESVWNVSFIKESLSEMSHSKCAYCECRIGYEGSYLEVEHYHPKGLYPEEVLEWNNLLPSCKRCNGKKGNWDTVKYPMVHPGNEFPKEHFKIKRIESVNPQTDDLEFAYVIKGITGQGELATSKLALNDSIRLMVPRQGSITALVKDLEFVRDELFDLKYGELSDKRKNRIQNKLENLMKEGYPDKPYAALKSHVILNLPAFIEIKKVFHERGIWSQAFQESENTLQEITLP